MNRSPLIMLALLLGLVLGPVAPAAAGTLKVKPGQSIQDAVTAASLDQDVDTVIVSAGTYYENVVITSDGLTLKTKGKVILDARPQGSTGTGPGIIVFANDVTLIGFTVRHAKFEDANIGVAVEGSGALLKRLTVQHCGDFGILVGGDDARITQCVVEGADVAGIAVEGARAEIDRCRVRNCALGIALGAEDAEGGIERCVVETTANEGIVYNGTGGRVWRNKVSGSGRDALFLTGDQNSIRGNRARDCEETGITVAGDANTIQDNRAERSAQGGMLVGGSANEIIGNKMRGCGIDVDDDDDIHGVGLLVGGDDNLLFKNNVEASGSDGIFVVGEFNVIRRNRSRHNAEDGLQLFGNDNTVETNRLLSNGGEGFDHGAAGTTSIGNTAQGNRLDITNFGTFDEFSNNTFETGGTTTFPEIDD